MGNALIIIGEVIRSPLKKTEKAAGYNLKSTTAFDAQPFSQITVGTGVRVLFPARFYGQIMDKLSFSTRTNLFTVARVIDEDYTGEIKVVLFNPTPTLRSVAKDIAFAQLVVLPIFTGSVFNIKPQQADGWSRPSARGPSGFRLPDTAALPNGFSNQRR
jgi:dUTP pyrophosphatase